MRYTTCPNLYLHKLLKRASLLFAIALIAAIQGCAQPLPEFTEFRELEGIYEPSAAEQMPDGRIFVVEDEVAHSLAIISIQPDGTFTVERLDPEVVFAALADEDSPGIPEDLEGIAVDDDGFVYIITSHSRETDGKNYPRRDKLVRFKVDGTRFTEMAAYDNLKADIAARHPFLAKSAEVVNVKEEGGFNIEAIAFDKDKKKLIVGFRSPQQDGKAILVTIENPQEIFEKDVAAKIGEEMIQFDMKDNGVRGMAYDPRLDGYLIISGPTSRDRTLNFGLWFWDGKSGSGVVPVTIPGAADAINRGECVTPIRWNGNERVLLIRDDGKKSKKKEMNANYMFLTYDQLKMEK